MRLLYVDDEEDILQLARIAMRFEEGVEVTLALSGAQALEILETQSFDALVIDAMMPAPDGPQVVAQLRSDPRFEGLAIVLASAMTHGPEHDRIVQAGADRVIAKPFDLATLRVMLDQLILQRAGRAS
ncbi:response regulator [uncultured Albimonas sp.]|uniref:response regulator n=1 Tax=uncultured Albimonas sp. TaxID=1331701 RepID=UPI0030EB924D|tara:strand:+ start:11642 stop:12025 length:384 start_codon:yes stop_codon:yes gene_type:complete